MGEKKWRKFWLADFHAGNKFPYWLSERPALSEIDQWIEVIEAKALEAKDAQIQELVGVLNKVEKLMKGSPSIAPLTDQMILKLVQASLAKHEGNGDG